MRREDANSTIPTLWKPAAWAAVFLGVVFLCGCGTAVVETAAPTPTPTPAVVSFGMTVDLSITPTPPPPPTPTPTPPVTPTPFWVYAPTVNMTFDELVGGTNDFGEFGAKTVNWPKGYPAADTYQIIVDKYWQVVMVYTKDPLTGEYTVPVRYMLCSTGNPRIDGGYETRVGTFPILKPRVRFGHFLSGEAAQYWTLIRGRTYFHSILYDDANDISSYQVESYTALGSKASHACIRLTVPDARWIWYNIAYGTSCIIREGDKEDMDTSLIRSQLVLPPAPATQLKTLRAGLTPHTDNWRIEDVATDLPFVNEKQPPPPLGDDEEDDEPTDPQTTDPVGGTGDATGDTPGGEPADPGTGGGTESPFVPADPLAPATP